jgi:hypothetical protein
MNTIFEPAQKLIVKPFFLTGWVVAQIARFIPEI